MLADRYVVFDSKLPAFGLRVGRTGSKTFQLFFRVNGSPRLRMATLGRLGVITLDQARRKAREMLGDVAAGEDPLARRDAAKAELPIRTTIARWLEEHVQARRKPATYRNYKLAVEQHIVPALGSIPVSQVAAADVSKLHGRLKIWRTAWWLPCRRSCRGASAKAIDLCGRIRASASRDMRNADTSGTSPSLVTARLRQAIRDAEASGTVAPAALTAIRLLLLTGCRPAEILTLQWRDVDLRRSVLQLPDSKTGAKTVHLPAAAAKLLKRWPKFAGSTYVFPGTGRRVRGAHLVNLAKPWTVLRTAAKLEDVRLYDACRHSFASMGISRHGHALSVVGELLGHTQAATTKRYAHLHDDAARGAASAIGASIAAALRPRRA